jgi:crotonobetainyl-CoA:carnitine CoA-transferase CaiB-like acyl-CoA transferase
MGAPAWSTDTCYRTLPDRIAHQDELERQLADWTRSQDGAQLQQELLEAGVPSGVALKTLDLFEDPQLMHRQHFVPLDHPEMGRWKYDELAFKLPDSPSQLCVAAPLLGQHTEQVLKEFLGYSDAEYAALSEAGVLQ